MREADKLRREAEKCLGWAEGESNSMSFEALRSRVYAKNPDLSQKMRECMERGDHIYEDA